MQVNLDEESYNILDEIRKEYEKKGIKGFTFSDAIRVLQNKKESENVSA